MLFANWFVRMSESFPQNWQKLGNFQSSDSADVILPKCLQMFAEMFGNVCWAGQEGKIDILDYL